jgi:lactoylglutathione lyase
MKFGYTIVYVSSVMDTLTFYKDAFGFETRFLHESGDYGELATGETVLAFACHDLGDMNLNGAYHSKPWGQVVAYVRSKEGTLIELCSPIGG